MAVPAHDTYPTPAPEDAATAPDPVSEEARRAFLRMMSHELRTPLNSIIGFSEIIASEMYGPLGAPQYREYAGMVQVSGQRLLRLVNQALEIMRLEGGAIDFDLHAEPVDAIIDDAIALCEDDAAPRGVVLAYDPPDQPVFALCDPRGLRTALVNLLQNAITFSPDGGEVRVTLDCEGADVRVGIQDRGEGLNPADIPRLMRPFEQGENALVRRSEGAGLGWPIVRLWIKAMGGDFRVDSAPGEGLTARLRLTAG